MFPLCSALYRHKSKFLHFLCHIIRTLWIGYICNKVTRNTDILLTCLICVLSLYQNILLSDSSSDEDADGADFTQEDLHEMLKLHKYQKRCQLHFYRDPEVRMIFVHHCHWGFLVMLYCWLRALAKTPVIQTWFHRIFVHYGCCDVNMICFFCQYKYCKRCGPHNLSYRCRV